MSNSVNSVYLCTFESLSETFCTFMYRVAQKHYSSQDKVNVLLLSLISQLNVDVAQFKPLGFTVCHFAHIQVHKPVMQR